MKKKKISLLGSTGTIGVQTLEVVSFLNFSVVALSANENINLLEVQARKFKPEVVCIFNKKFYKEFKLNVSDCFFKIVCGMEGLCEVASLSSASLIVNAVVGTNGLLPTLVALENGKNVAMANKEAVVVGSEFIEKTAKKNGCRVLPIDSEHSAIFQCLEKENEKKVSKIFLMASGGPFFGKTRLELASVSVSQALNHPRWKMGRKISVDSATLMNKGLELIEACGLFNVDSKIVEVVVHPQAVLHSAVSYCDGSVLGQFGVTDMRLPIQFALTWPERFESLVKPFSFFDCENLNFFKPDYETFGCLGLCKKAARKKGLLPCIVHAANEQAVELFLSGKIKFLEIEKLVMQATELEVKNEVKTVAEILKFIEYVKNFVRQLVES